jgi:dihydrofolate reductase
MGRKTWESLPKKPLPNRINVVFSTRPIDGVDVVGSMREYHEYIAAHDELIENVYIIGGSSIYNMFLEDGLVDEIICTVFYPKKTSKPIEQVADTFFPIHELQRFVKGASEYIGEGDNYVAIVEYYKLNFHNKI